MRMRSSLHVGGEGASMKDLVLAVEERVPMSAEVAVEVANGLDV